jgi:hypothetical protein
MVHAKMMQFFKNKFFVYFTNLNRQLTNNLLHGTWYKDIVKKMCRVSARRLSVYNFAWGLLKATKKVYLSEKKTKIHIGSIRQSLQVQR